MKRPVSDPLLRWRTRFPILSESTYLISNSLGAMPRDVRAGLREYADTWAARGVRAWAEAWWGMQTSAADAVAPLIGARAGELSVHSNVSLAQAQVISAIRFTGKKREIVFSDMEFPSMMYVCGAMGRDRGAKVIVKRARGSAAAAQQKVYDAIGEKTKLVPISHVFFRNAEIQDVAEIARKAHRWGATVVLDAYHSVGIVPVDVRALGVDILTGGVLKWLCGGPGGAFLWIRPSLLKSMEPKVTGWAAHRAPFAFETRMRYAPGAARMLTGTPAVTALYAMTAGPRIIGRVGIGNIRAKSMRQTALIAETSARLGFTMLSPSDPERRGGAVTLSVPHAYRVSREL
ncbi:MAG TPA: aminotransferase class V-fold PLP-dependent enzyme, partial [Bacteroidota bacterium]|nr:aminotransferase class V-fold PLP-dependent enzyme [Bacteroidota bacterium]